MGRPQVLHKMDVFQRQLFRTHDAVQLEWGLSGHADTKYMFSLIFWLIWGHVEPICDSWQQGFTEIKSFLSVVTVHTSLFQHLKQCLASFWACCFYPQQDVDACSPLTAWVCDDEPQLKLPKCLFHFKGQHILYHLVSRCLTLTSLVYSTGCQVDTINTILLQVE